MEYYSIAEIARILKIPESTARYYRDRHRDFMDHTGRGRKKRYKKQALEAMRLICEDTIKATYRPEEFRELLKKAGAKRVTAINTTKRLFRGVTKVDTYNNFNF